jgi:nucleoid DNA-binding protein
MRKAMEQNVFSRADLARLMWESGRMSSLKHSKKSVTALVETIIEICSAGNKVGIAGFGIFEIIHTKERRLKNNYFTKGTCILPGKRRFKFRESEKLKSRINQIEE